MKSKLFFFFLFFTTTICFACSCVRGTLEQDFASTNLIFTGKVIKIIEIDKYDSIPSTIDKSGFFIRKFQRVEVTLKLKKLIKGDTQQKEITIVTSKGLDQSNGDLNLQIGKRYLIFSKKSDVKLNASSKEDKVPPYYFTSICSRTKRLSKVKHKHIRNLKLLAKEEGSSYLLNRSSRFKNHKSSI